MGVTRRGGVATTNTTTCAAVTSTVTQIHLVELLAQHAAPAEAHQERIHAKVRARLVDVVVPPDFVTGEGVEEAVRRNAREALDPDGNAAVHGVVSTRNSLRHVPRSTAGATGHVAATSAAPRCSCQYTHTPRKS